MTPTVRSARTSHRVLRPGGATTAVLELTIVRLRSVRSFLSNQLVLLRQEFLHDRSYAILLLRRELRNERWYRSGVSDAGKLQCVMQNTAWSPRIPEIFKL